MSAKQVSPQGMKTFLDYRFGMFIHWGLYSLIAHGEWAMHLERIPVAEYEKLVPQFNPYKFNADEWVSIAADAGQKYMVITSRHHDGFSMYDTRLSDYKVTNTPFKRDPLRELADACARRGDVKLGFYSSLLDWHHPAYRFRDESKLAWSDYIAFLHGQVRELCTDFGEIACVWFDGDWPREDFSKDERVYFTPGGSFEYDKLYDMIHTLQPNAVVHNNRHVEPLPGEDIQGFEQDLPGENSTGFNTTSVYDLPAETCMTINDSWGINTGDYNQKSGRYLVSVLARLASGSCNFLLNVGPTALGEITTVQAQRLAEVGAWLKVNGESIYGTQAGIIPAGKEFASTSKGNTHYLHVYNYVSDCVKVKGVPETVSQATLLRDKAPIRMNRTQDGFVMLMIPPERRDSMDTVIVLS